MKVTLKLKLSALVPQKNLFASFDCVALVGFGLCLQIELLLEKKCACLFNFLLFCNRASSYFVLFIDI